MKSFKFYYDTINEFYGTTCAKRSGIPYIAHIMEGLNVLDAIGASDEAKFAYMLHPIFQDDAAVINLKKYAHIADPYVLGLCMEYRSIANQYLSKRQINSVDDIKLSPLKDVNDMLIADKVQNYKDFLLYQDNHERRAELDQYFKNWHFKLGINFYDLEKYCFNIAVTCIIKAKDKYLLLKRFSHDRTMSGYCNVGGKLEQGERLIDGLYREISEEIGTNFITSAVQYHDSFYAQTKRGPIAVLTYKIELTNPLAVKINNDEFEGYEWVSEEQFNEFWFADEPYDEERDIFIGIDFDGTVIGNDIYPAVVGEPNPMAIEVMEEMIDNGLKIVLWTMRSSEQHAEIKQFFKDHGVDLYAINKHKTQWKWTDSPKLYADYFIDDRNLCTPLTENGCVDWNQIRIELQNKNWFKK